MNQPIRKTLQLKGKRDGMPPEQVEFVDCSFLPMKVSELLNFLDDDENVNNIYGSEGMAMAYLRNGELHMNSKFSQTTQSLIVNKFLFESQTRH